MSEDSQPASVQVITGGSDCVLILHGTFRLDGVQELYEAAVRSAAISSSLIVDCSEAEHLDGCALQVLLTLKREVEGAGGSLRLRGASEPVRKQFRWAGLAAHFSDYAPGAAQCATTPGSEQKEKS